MRSENLVSHNMGVIDLELLFYLPLIEKKLVPGQSPIKRWLTFTHLYPGSQPVWHLGSRWRLQPRPFPLWPTLAGQQLWEESWLWLLWVLCSSKNHRTIVSLNSGHSAFDLIYDFTQIRIVICKISYSQVCVFPNHIQSFEFTTGGQSWCRNISTRFKHHSKALKTCKCLYIFVLSI